MADILTSTKGADHAGIGCDAIRHFNRRQWQLLLRLVPGPGQVADLRHSKAEVERLLGVPWVAGLHVADVSLKALSNGHALSQLAPPVLGNGLEGHADEDLRVAPHLLLHARLERSRSVELAGQIDHDSLRYRGGRRRHHQL